MNVRSRILAILYNILHLHTCYISILLYLLLQPPAAMQWACFIIRCVYFSENMLQGWFLYICYMPSLDFLCILARHQKIGIRVNKQCIRASKSIKRTLGRFNSAGFVSASGGIPDTLEFKDVSKPDGQVYQHLYDFNDETLVSRSQFHLINSTYKYLKGDYVMMKPNHFL